MRGHLAIVVACAGLGACVPDPDSSHTDIFLPPAYSSLPPAPPESIEAGLPVALEPQQQEAVVMGVARWMKHPDSVEFGEMDGARNSHGLIVVCGQVNGRNSAGRYVGLAPFIGVLMGTTKSPDFVLVGIASSSRERQEVTLLCRESGVAKKT
jgi:hypothetical protein